MEIQEMDVVVTNPETYTQLSAVERAMTVLRMSGRCRWQAEELMSNHALVGSMVNNILVCRDPELQNRCVPDRNRLEAELAMYPPKHGQAPWSDGTTLDLLIVAAKSDTPPRDLLLAFARAEFSDGT